MSRPAITAGLSACGRVVIAITAACGCCEIERELSDVEARQFAAMLATQIELGKRVQQLPHPWIHGGGQA